MSQPLSNALLAAVFAAVFALAAQGAAAQGKPKPPADKAPATQEAKAATGGAHPTNENFHAQCIGCHGIPGYKTAYPVVYHVPKIAGQNPAYIVAALKAYKSGERSHPSMRGIAASMSEEQMKAMADYYGAPAK
jgi:cytochrome c553